MKATYICALDQGTTSSRAIIFDARGRALGSAQREFAQFYPREGWVEHDPMEILASQTAVMHEAVAKAGIKPAELAGLGITNQRETTVVWNRRTGKPIHNAIVWQCRRTAELCTELKRAGHETLVREATGLVLDAYFSATKIAWILDTVPGAREQAERGELAFGTVDCWLLWNLSGGVVHATDCTNASRTMLYNIRSLDWDERLLALFRVPRAVLPVVKPSAGFFGESAPSVFDGRRVPITGMAGDQQAALFGQACFEPGMAKNTYGTGCFLVMNTGVEPVRSKHGLLTTIAYGLHGRTVYGLEGSVFIAGAAVQWLRDELKLISNARETEYLAAQVEDSGGVYLVPAFVGLGAPHWDMYARGALVGLTRGSGKNHLVRATLESIAYQTRDVLEAIVQDSGTALAELKVDGGAAANNFLMQFQADLLGVPVTRPRIIETTALGAAFLAGLGLGLFKSLEEVAETWAEERRFSPGMPVERREKLYSGWKKALDRARGWLD